MSRELYYISDLIRIEYEQPGRTLQYGDNGEIQQRDWLKTGERLNLNKETLEERREYEEPLGKDNCRVESREYRIEHSSDFSVE